jgi:hypothetical protein
LGCQLDVTLGVTLVTVGVTCWLTLVISARRSA